MKRIKKLAAFVIAAIMILSITTVAFGDIRYDEYGNVIENEDLGGFMTASAELPASNGFVHGSFVSISGEVTEIRTVGDTDFIRIAFERDDENGLGYFDFRLDMNTFVLGDEISEGDVITGFYNANAPVIMIYPPQHLAYVLVNRVEDLPFVFVGRFNDEWISFDGERYLVFGDDVEIVFQGGDAFTGEIDELIGRMLVVEYYRAGRDINPTTTFPERITVLYERIVPLPEDIGMGLLLDDIDIDDIVELDDIGTDVEIVAICDEIDWSVYPVIVNNEGVPGARYATVGDNIFPTHVSLRAVTEFLGFVPEWNAELRAVTVDSPRGTIAIRINSGEYTVNGETYNLDPAVIIDDYTFVPLAFFRIVFGFNNAYFEGGHVQINDNELME